MKKKTAAKKNVVQFPKAKAPEDTAPSIRLLHDEVLIKLTHPERMTHGLWIPDSAKRSAGELWRGTVVAVGPGARTAKKGILIPCDVEPGDVVGFYWRAAVVDVMKWPSEDFRLIHETDIQWKQVA